MAIFSETNCNLQTVLTYYCVWMCVLTYYLLCLMDSGTTIRAEITCKKIVLWKSIEFAWLEVECDLL